MNASSPDDNTTNKGRRLEAAFLCLSVFPATTLFHLKLGIPMRVKLRTSPNINDFFTGKPRITPSPLPQLLRHLNLYTEKP